MKARLAGLTFTFDGKQRLVLDLQDDFRDQYDELKDIDVDVTIKKHRKTRSLDANAYAWTLIDRIAYKTGQSKSNVYRDAIRSIGGVADTVCVQDKAVKALTDAWTMRGLGWQVETFPSKIDGCTNVMLFYGSSTYDTKQMSLLIDMLVQDAKELGIETLSPEKLNSLIGGNNGRK